MDNTWQYATFLILQFSIYLCIDDSVPKSINKEFCLLQTFNPDCELHSVIIIKRAFYGRMKLGVCDVDDQGPLRCSSDVKDIINARCAGKKTCSIGISDNELLATKPCGQMLGYLEVEYICQPVSFSSNEVCDTCDGIELIKPSGYISSLETIKSNCGLSSCPWVLKGSKGQKINLELYDYSFRPNQLVGNSCQVYAIVEDLITKKSTTVCGKKSPELTIPESWSHSISISLMNPNKANFLIYYEFYGCPDVEKKGFIFSRDKDKAILKCSDSESEFILICDGSSWKNLDSIDCFNVDQQVSDGKGKKIFPISLEYLILLISSVAFLFGACILVCGIYAFCRKPNQDLNAPHAIYKDVPVYDSVYNQPIRHPGRDFRYAEEIDEETIIKSFPRMSTKKHLHNLQSHVSEAPVDPRNVNINLC